MIKLTRIFAAGILGGMIMMAVAFALHRPPLDELGWTNLPSDTEVRSTLSASLGHDSGLYVFPALVGITSDNADAMNAYDRSLETGPSGFILYRATGVEVIPGRAMIEELLKNLIVATLAAFLLSQASKMSNYIYRVCFVLTIGAISSVSTHISYHAWFGFPVNYTIGRVILDFVPWIFSSAFIALLVRPIPSKAD